MEDVNKLSVISYTCKRTVSNVQKRAVYRASKVIQNYVCHNTQCLWLNYIILILSPNKR